MHFLRTLEFLRALGLIWVVANLGCSAVRTSGRLPLSPPSMGRDSITVEKFSVRFNHGDPVLNEQIWSEIDEESLPAEVRSRLAANGFRAGVIDGHLPQALENALREGSSAPLQISKPEQPLQANSPDAYEPKPVDLLHEPRVRRGLWQTRSGNAGIIVTAGEQTRIPSVPVLVRGEDGRVTGRCYERVMGALTMKAFAERDGRVRLEMVPELEYGDMRSRFVAEHGMIKPDYRPETVVFKELRLDTILAPGQMLILGSRADKPGTLGHHFLTEQRSGEPLEQKLLLLRLAQAPVDDSFRGGEIPPASP